MTLIQETFTKLTHLPLGEWHQEPSWKVWVDGATGIQCSIVRHKQFGTLCGYVILPEGHPWVGKHYSDIEVEVHGDLSWSGKTSDGLWQIGFDCAHAFDLKPRMDLRPESGNLFRDSIYRNVAYVAAECAKLAAQVKSAMVTA